MLLENGEYATLPENLNFIFEVGDLENELPENIVEQVETNQTLCQAGRSWRVANAEYAFDSFVDLRQKTLFLHILLKLQQKLVFTMLAFQLLS